VKGGWQGRSTVDDGDANGPLLQERLYTATIRGLARVRLVLDRDLARERENATGRISA